MGWKGIDLQPTFWKESLNSGGQQFCQYQQNEQLPFGSNHWKHRKTTTSGVGNLDSGLGQAQRCGGVKLGLMVSQLFTSW